MSLLLLIAVAVFAGAGLMYFAGTFDPDVLLSPAVALAIWSLAIGLWIVGGGILDHLRTIFWIVTLGLTVAGAIAVLVRRPQTLLAFAIPATAAAVVMAPYLVHGLAAFPGSWFWDGFAYMAIGESLSHFPRIAIVPGLDLFDAFGHYEARGRFVSGALISTFRGIFPLGGDAQQAIGYFLLFAVLTFASSCAYLANAALPNHPRARIAFVALATVSGAVVDLIWANNFDHLLALSIMPAALGLAMNLRLGSIGDAVLLGAFAAAEVYIYPELAPLMLLPAVLATASHLFRSRDTLKTLATATAGLLAFGLLILPMWHDLTDFLAVQIHAALSPRGGSRPGEGYYPTLFSRRCGPGAMLHLYAPFSTCSSAPNNAVRLIASLSAIALLMRTLFAWRKVPTLILCAFVIIIVAGYFLVVQQYDYGASKILISGWPVLMLLVVTAAATSGKAVQSWATLTAGALLLTVGGEIRSFDRSVAFKSIERFSVLDQAIPPDATVDLSISDPLSFQWAVYYLRTRQLTVSKGSLIYYKPEVALTIAAGAAQYLVTDQPLPDHASPIWSNDAYYIYARGSLATAGASP